MAEETVTVTTILAAVVLGVFAVCMCYVLGWANRVFHVDVDTKVEAILEALPGANCGACGFLPRIDYDKYDPQVNFEPVIGECPRESLVFVGESGERQLATFAGEGLPECVKADLPITVHDTE